MHEQYNPDWFVPGGETTTEPYILPPRTLAERQAVEHSEAVAGIAANTDNPQLARLLRALTRAIYPDYLCDQYALPALNPQVAQRYQINIPGIFRLSKLILMAPGGTFPSRVDVTIERISHVPFTLNAAKPELGPLRFPIANGTDIVLSNADTANGGTLYVEWELVNYG